MTEIDVNASTHRRGGAGGGWRELYPKSMMMCHLLMPLLTRDVVRQNEFAPPTALIDGWVQAKQPISSVGRSELGLAAGFSPVLYSHIRGVPARFLCLNPE